MGLNKSEKIKYLSIVNGKIAIPCTADTKDAEKFTNKEGTEKFYLFFNSLEGFLESISWKEPPELHPEWSANWILRIKDGSDMYQLQINFSSGYAHGFFCQLGNINPEESLTLSPSIKSSIWEGKEKEQRNLFVKQGGEWLKRTFTKDDPGELPEIEVTKTKKGKIFYDDTDRNDFFKTLAQQYNERRKLVKKDEPTEEVAAAVEEHLGGEETNKEDLPF